MDITLTISEQELLTDLATEKETFEDTLHRLLTPILKVHGETRLQRLADAYRALSPDDQVEAIEVLRKWQDTKGGQPLTEAAPALKRF